MQARWFSKCSIHAGKGYYDTQESRFLDAFRFEKSNITTVSGKAREWLMLCDATSSPSMLALKLQEAVVVCFYSIFAHGLGGHSFFRT